MSDTTYGEKLTGPGTSDIQAPAECGDVVPVSLPSSSNDGQNILSGSMAGPSHATAITQEGHAADLRERERDEIPIDAACQSQERESVCTEPIASEGILIPFTSVEDVLPADAYQSQEVLESASQQALEKTYPVSDSYSDVSSRQGGSLPATPLARRKRQLDADMITAIKKEKTKSRKIISTQQPHAEDDDALLRRKKRVAGRKVPTIADVDAEEVHESDTSSRMDVDKGNRTDVSQSEARSTRKTTKSKYSGTDDAGSDMVDEREREDQDPTYEEPEIGALGGVTSAKYENMAAESLGNTIILLTKEIETIRVKSKRIQGKLSGHMKCHLLDIQAGVTALVGKALATGDPSILKMQNKELIVRNRELEKEIARLKDRLRHSPSAVSSPPRRRKVEKILVTPDITHHIEDSPTGQDGQDTPMARDSVDQQERTRRVEEPEPLPQRQQRPMRGSYKREEVANVRSIDPNAPTEKEMALSRRINELVKQRNEEKEKRRRETARYSISRETQQGQVEPARNLGRNMPRIISNVQLRPPRPQYVTTDMELGTTAPSADEEGWQIARGGRRKQERKEKTYASMARTVPAGGPAKVKPGGVGTGPRIKRRSPRTAAVSITGIAADFSYADALRRARDSISLESLGIDAPRVRRAMNGGLLIEIPGDDGKIKADKLAAELRGVLEGVATVARPMKKGELRIIGLDDSVTPEEVVCVLAGIGDCLPDEVRTGPIRPMRSGLGSLWVQLPLAAAIKAADVGRFRVGWTMARVYLLNSRPTQCYRCWRFGHVQAACKSSVDRTGTCFRCGEKGHATRSCTGQLSCLLCKERGLTAGHRMGGPYCSAVSAVKGDTFSDRRPNLDPTDNA